MHRRNRHLLGKAIGANLVLDSRYIQGSDGTAIGTWSDRSGNGKDATQATSNKRPLLRTGSNGINGNPVLNFDGSDDAMVISSITFKSFFYILMVVQLNTSSILCEHSPDTNNNSGFYVYGQFNANVNINRAGVGNAGASLNSPTNWIGSSNAIVFWYYAGTNDWNYYTNFNQIVKNNVFNSLNNTNTDATNELNIMARNEVSLYSAGKLGLMIVSSGTYSPEFRKRINHLAAFSFKIACS
jgi:hypothetical protein